MTITKLKYAVSVLLVFFPLIATAQLQQSADSISIFELMHAVEKNTSCRIFTTMAQPFKIKGIDSDKPTAEHLRQALSATPYKVTVYGKQIFVLPDTYLYTSVSPILRGKKIESGEQVSSFVPVVKSTSENRVYEIGNKFKSSSGETVTLTGKVTDFKTGQSLEGINVVHRDPWVATVTNRRGDFSIQLPVGYNSTLLGT